MKVIPQLDLDTPYDQMSDGKLCHASNIILTADGINIQNENSLIDFSNIPAGYNIVGVISCNEEFILFFDNNKIARIKTDGSYKELTTNWKWCGGEVFGTYTYNVNNELIISFSERNATKDVALKTINLDRFVYIANYNDDDIYTNRPIVPIANFSNYYLDKGSKIRIGTYVFFIRYYINEYEKTLWFPIGLPIVVYDKYNYQIAKQTLDLALVGETETDKTPTVVKIDDYYNDDLDYCNISLNIVVDINNILETSKLYTQFELGYIINYNGGTEARRTVKYDYNIVKTVNISLLDEIISLDELTVSEQSFYNVGTLCNYRNRVYLGNYKVDNPNTKLKNIDTSGVRIYCVGTNDELSTLSKNEEQTYITNYCYYSFFIHYVYKDGTYSDGIQIRTLNSYTTNGMNYKMESYVNNNGDYIYRTDQNMKVGIRFVFENIPIIEDAVGYFISYEEPEYVEIGEGLATAINSYLYNATYKTGLSAATFYFNYPEFDIIGGYTDVGIIKQIATLSGKTARSSSENETKFYDVYENSNLIDGEKYDVSGTNIITPNIDTNIGREGHLKITANKGITFNTNQLYVGIRGTVDSNGHYEIAKTFYGKKDKKLIPLGFIKLKTGATGNYGDDANYKYNNNYYLQMNSVYQFHHDGVLISDTVANPTNYTTKKLFYQDNVIADGTREPHVFAIRYLHFSHYPLFAKKANYLPRTIAYNYSDGSTNIQKINTVIEPSRVNELFKLEACYYDYLTKLIYNYRSDLISNTIENYYQTVYRSDVISDESIENRWKNFQVEAYKRITENKGAITNIVAAGTLLIVHTEKSMFVFNVDNTLKTQDKDVQMLMPDVFEVNYQEVFTTERGFAGFQDFISYSVGNYGYIFYDSNAKVIYRYDNNSIAEITTGIINYIRNKNIKYIYIGEDSVRSRLLFNFIDEDDNSNILSYNLVNNTWLSAHSYTSNYSFISMKDNIYIIDKNITFKLKEFSKTTYNEYADNVLNKDFYNEVIDNVTCSYIDVYFNNGNYNQIKVLDFITYIINKYDTPFEILKIKLYSNCCYSGELDIREERKSIKDYKKPFYDFGRWNFNYFKNKVTDYKYENITDRISGEINPDLTFNDNRYNDNKLMTGKYIIVRIIFRDNTRDIIIKDVQSYFNK